ncbi:MFS-type transporter SLC18B1 isoform X2 [Parasteatoda tepidariorum]|nr:MFS-type transporter SLC18B1 isoform X2 [Parasteatoda tepidariorum]XP_015928380.1 MFS-type transporter SLC18B1 isoform X2 [Parasteatoda tepidariorum]XP_015928381.1 MFS-type transporter SLC18B1 isoform X2 [Parasteatoda tepidariorum]XP_042897059.1 MFS-type transporter SLC18B1 isoform X2 [Parasteatoda tepidariorum]
MKQPNSEKEAANEESDEQDKISSSNLESPMYENFHHSDEQRLINDDEKSFENQVHSSLPKNFNGYHESPRSQLAKYVPKSPLKLDALYDGLVDSRVFIAPQNGNRSFHVSLSVDDDDDSDDDEQIYSKSADYSEETINSLHQNCSMIRSVSEDILRRRPDMERRLSMVSSSKGRLAAIPRLHPKEKHLAPSTGALNKSSIPPAPSTDEEELIEKAPFPRDKILVVMCLCLVDFTAYLSMSIIAPFFPREASNKGMREAVSGFVFSIYALLIMLTSPFFGKMLPYVGAKFMLFSGVAFCGTTNILFGLLDLVDGTVEFTALCFIVRAFEAIGAAAFCTASMTILIDQFPDHISTIFGLVETSMGIGMSVGPAIGGALYAAGGFTLPFYALGGFVLFTVPIMYLLLLKTPDPKSVIASTNEVSYLKILSMPHILVICVLLAMTSQILGFIDPTLEPHMRQYGLDAGLVGLLFLLLSATYGIAAPIVGWLSNKFENKYPLMLSGLLFITVSMLLLGPSEILPIQGSLWLSIASLGFLGIFIAVALIPTFESMFIVCMNNGFEDDINTYSVVSGLWNSVYSLGEVTGPSLGGVLCDFYSFPQAASLMALCTLLAFALGLVAWLNPRHIFGLYNVVEDAPRKMNLALASHAQEVSRVPSREASPLQNAYVHTYGSLSEDKKDPIA